MSSGEDRILKDVSRKILQLFGVLLLHLLCVEDIHGEHLLWSVGHMHLQYYKTYKQDMCAFNALTQCDCLRPPST